MSESVNRPKAKKGKIHSKNEFELCYLRHQYLRKTKHNPSLSEMKPYLPIVQHFAKNSFYTYKKLFDLVGLGLEDVVSIGQIHLVSFLGLFTLEMMPEKLKNFIDLLDKKDIKINDSTFLNKNKADFTSFLKQRMEDVVRVCRQKARNIRGLPTEEYFVFCGPNRPPLVLRDLVDKYEKLGFRKLDMAVYRSIKKKLKTDDSPAFQFNGLWYVAVPVEQRSLGLVDFSGADLDPYNNVHNMDPERVYFDKEMKKELEILKDKFDNETYKATVIRRFIRKNKSNSFMKEEVNIAKKYLKSMGN